MATGAQVWSQVAATNATIDTNINFAEGQAPSSLNDSNRAGMASVARWISDNNCTLVTSGSTTALTLATNQIEAALTAGYTVRFQFGTGAAAAATLAVDGLSAVPLQNIPGTNLSGTEYSSGAYGSFTYSSTGTGQWISNTYTNPLGVSTIFAGAGATAPTGTVSTVGVMMGLGSTFKLTPAHSGRVLVIAQGGMGSQTNADNATIHLYYGTGSAPANAAALTGTIVTPAAVYTSPVSGGYYAPFCLATIITGLTIGTAYWFDIAVASNTGAATAGITNTGITLLEI